MGLAFKNEGGSQSFSTAVGDYFASEGGGDVPKEVPLNPFADIYKKEVQRLMDAGVDVVSMTAGTSVSSAFMKAWNKVDPDTKLFLGNDVVTQNFIKLSTPPGKKVGSFSKGKQELANGNRIDYHGASGPQNFNNYGDPVGPIAIQQVKDGKWTKVKEFKAKELTL
jgi:hypothetical protein